MKIKFMQSRSLKVRDPVSSHRLDDSDCGWWDIDDFEPPLIHSE